VSTLREPPARRVCVTGYIEDEQGNKIAISVGFQDCHCGCGKSVPCEVFMTERAKSGTALEDLLYQAGVVGSKIMQGE
jgi:hypothetical protein